MIILACIPCMRKRFSKDIGSPITVCIDAISCFAQIQSSLNTTAWEYRMCPFLSVYRNQVTCFWLFFLLMDACCFHKRLVPTTRIPIRWAIQYRTMAVLSLCIWSLRKQSCFKERLLKNAEDAWRCFFPFVRIDENPSVFAARCMSHPESACMCMNGQPRLAALVALELFYLPHPGRLCITQAILIRKDCGLHSD